MTKKKIAIQGDWAYSHIASINLVILRSKHAAFEEAFKVAFNDDYKIVIL